MSRFCDYDTDIVKMQNIEKGGFLAKLNKNYKTPVFNGYDYQKIY